MIFGFGRSTGTARNINRTTGPALNRSSRRGDPVSRMSVQEVVDDYRPDDRAGVRQLLEGGLDQKHRWLYLEFKYDRRGKAITIAAQKREKGIFSAVKRFLPGAKSRRAQKAANSFRSAVREAFEDLGHDSLSRYVTPSSTQRRKWVSLEHFRSVNNVVNRAGQEAVNQILTERVVPSIAPKVQDDSWGAMAEGAGLNPGDRNLQLFFVQRFPAYLVDRLGRESKDKLLDYEGKKYDDLPRPLKQEVGEAAISLMGRFKDMNPPQPERVASDGGVETPSILEMKKKVNSLFTYLFRDESGKFVDGLDALVKSAEQTMRGSDPLYDSLNADDYEGRRDRAVDSILTSALNGVSSKKQSNVADELLANIEDIGQHLKKLEAKDLKGARLADGGATSYVKSYLGWGYDGFWNALGYQMPKRVTETERVKDRSNFRREFIRQLSLRLSVPEDIRADLEAAVSREIIAADT